MTITQREHDTLELILQHVQSYNRAVAVGFYAERLRLQTEDRQVVGGDLVIHHIELRRDAV